MIEHMSDYMLGLDAPNVSFEYLKSVAEALNRLTKIFLSQEELTLKATPALARLEGANHRGRAVRLAAGVRNL